MIRRHLPYNRNLKQNSRKLRKNMTKAEKHIWYNFLRDFKYRVLRQKPIDNFIVDFYCAKLKLVIEIDGDYHFEDEQKEYDENRTMILESNGIKVIRFTNQEVLENLEYVIEIINQELKDNPPD